MLVDSCVWSLMLRSSAQTRSGTEQAALQSLNEAIHHGTVAIIGPIRQEILSGIKHAAQFENLRKTLGHFRDEPVSTADYVEAARLYNLCRADGIECGSTDMVICAVAARLGSLILTSDKGLERCIAFLKSAS